MRRTFYDILESLEFDVHEEYSELLYLFDCEPAVAWRGKMQKLSEVIDDVSFRDLPFRGRFSSLFDMMNELELDQPSDDLNDLFVFCEFLIAVMPKNVKRGSIYESISKVIWGNIENILEKTNHEFIQDPRHNDRYIIVEKNKSATLAAQIVEDEEVAFELLEYNHHALKGELSKKRKILVSIGAYIEPILREKTLSNAGYKELESNVGFLLNKFHIRHNNKEGKTAQDYIVSITDEELEVWYDKTYDVLIQAILTNENIEVESAIKQLKKDYKWR